MGSGPCAWLIIYRTLYSWFLGRPRFRFSLSTNLGLLGLPLRLFTGVSTGDSLSSSPSLSGVGGVFSSPAHSHLSRFVVPTVFTSPVVTRVTTGDLPSKVEVESLPMLSPSRSTLGVVPTFNIRPEVVGHGSSSSPASLICFLTSHVSRLLSQPFLHHPRPRLLQLIKKLCSFPHTMCPIVI